MAQEYTIQALRAFFFKYMVGTGVWVAWGGVWRASSETPLCLVVNFHEILLNFKPNEVLSHWKLHKPLPRPHTPIPTIYLKKNARACGSTQLLFCVLFIFKIY